MTAEKTCCRCREIKPVGDFSPGHGTCKECRRDQRSKRRHGVPGCDVWMVNGGGPCVNPAVREFSAVCECGHPMEGAACETCLAAALLGCLTCWQEKRHKCAVRFEQPALTVARAS